MQNYQESKMTTNYTPKGYINSEALLLVVLVFALQLIGCASTVEKDANKNLFQQALVLQKVNATGQSNQTVRKEVMTTPGDRIDWLFTAKQVMPNATQKQELFLWFSQLSHYSDNPILLQLGPDWISSYRRGNAIRKMIPRGILIEQQYDDTLPEHSVTFSLKVNRKSNAIRTLGSTVKETL